MNNIANRQSQHDSVYWHCLCCACTIFDILNTAFSVGRRPQSPPFCLSACLSITHVSHTYMVQDIETHFASYDRAIDVSSFLRTNFVVLILGLHPERVCYREVPY